MKTGIITDCLKKPLPLAIEAAAEMGIEGVQIYATTGEFSPETLDAQKKNYYKSLISHNNLTVSALCADMGGFGFERAEDNTARVEKTKRIIDLAAEFGCGVITTHIGVIPSSKSVPRYSVMLRALAEIGRYAQKAGVTAAIETGPEKAAVLKMFVEDTDGGVGVNLDPANFTMVTGQDAVEAVEILAPYIVHTHVKDGKMLDKNQRPEDVYHAFALGGIDALNAMVGFTETPIGEGDVDFDAYFAKLRQIGYDGFLTIEREAGDNPEEDIRRAVAFIKKHL